MRSSIILTVVLASCGGGSAINPHSENVPAHEREAAQNDAEAREHERHYDPSAEQLVERCRSSGPAAGGDVCWESVVNPTQTELDQAAEHRRLAAEHRAASAHLRDAEAQACANVPQTDRDLCPLMHPEDISGVTPLQEPPAGGGPPALVGAVVKFRAVRGLDLAWLQRTLACHAAQADAFGEGYENPSCPLVLRGVTVQVTQAGDGFLVTLRARDAAEAETVLARARELVATPSAQ